MIPEIKRILFCTQLGPNAPYIFRYAYALAAGMDAKITVLHVVETLTPNQEAIVEGYVGSGTLHNLVEQHEKEAETELHRRIEGFCKREVGASGWEERIERILVAEGNAAQQILAQADELRPDLVVVGARTRPVVMKALLGSTALSVIRGSPAPVLVVRVPAAAGEEFDGGEA